MTLSPAGAALSYWTRKLREERGWTQEETATYAGLSRRTIVRIEQYPFHGDYSVSLVVAEGIARAFNVPLAAILTPPEEGSAV